MPSKVGIHSTDRRRLGAGLWVLTALLVLLAFTSVVVGSRDISFTTALQALINYDPSNTGHLLIWYSRMPRTLLAVVAAAALGCSGLIMQAMTRNPLADPGIFGINAGAALAIMIGLALFGITNFVSQIFISMIGAFAAGTFIYFLSGARRGVDPTKLVLSGTAFNIIVMALVQFIIVNNDETVYDFYREWIVGSFAGRDLVILGITTVAVVIGLIVGGLYSKQLDAQLLGADMAVTLGVNPVTMVFVCSTVVIVLAGTATAACGPIIFLGLVAPHLARFITGPLHQWCFPYTALIAANLALIADVLGRVVAEPLEVKVGIMLGLLGGPFFIFLVTRKKVGRL